MSVRLFLCGALAVLAAQPAAAKTALPPELLPPVFDVFKQWDRPDSGGCAVSVVQDGKVRLTRGYGRAHVESGTAITAATEFQLASVSKPLTAFAIHLLVSEGLLSLDADVRAYVPEMHVFPTPITIRHLLNHTSGLRDTWIFNLKAGRGGDFLTQQDVLNAIFDQRELNFLPGSQHVYSNANYNLLALVVERASGRPFKDFIAERIFTPLGMKNSYVGEDTREIRSGKATPYGMGPHGLERRHYLQTDYGPANIYSTAEDMALWTANLFEPKVGTRAMMAEMREAATDARGSAVPYGSGLVVKTHGGMATAEHGGILPGASAYIFTLPAKRFGVTLLCNMELNGLDLLSRAIADGFLGERREGAQGASPPIALPQAALERFAGTYKEPHGALFAIEVRNGKLVVAGPGDTLTPLGPAEFQVANAPVRLSFSDDGEGEGASTLTVHDPDRDRVMTRVTKATVPDLTAAAMAAYEGDYYSPELRTIVTVERRGSELWMVAPGYDARIEQPEQRLREPDAFTAERTGFLFFRRDARGRVSEFGVSNERVVNLRFLRIAPLPAL